MAVSRVDGVIVDIEAFIGSGVSGVRSGCPTRPPTGSSQFRQTRRRTQWLALELARRRASLTPRNSKRTSEIVVERREPDHHVDGRLRLGGIEVGQYLGECSIQNSLAFDVTSSACVGY